jgi:uncharacterized protein YwgA
MAKIDEIDRETDLAFLLFHYADDIEGTTELQKLLFLLEKETNFTDIYGDVTFDFQPYKYGPFSEQVYDELELLLALGALEEVEGETDYDEIKSDNERSEYAGKKFVLTEKGEKMARQVNEALEDELEEEFLEVIEEYGELELEDLLFYVYDQYGTYTTNSTIKEQVLDA